MFRTSYQLGELPLITCTRQACAAQSTRQGHRAMQRASSMQLPPAAAPTHPRTHTHTHAQRRERERKIYTQHYSTHRAGHIFGHSSCTAVARTLAIRQGSFHRPNAHELTHRWELVDQAWSIVPGGVHAPRYVPLALFHIEIHALARHHDRALALRQSVDGLLVSLLAMLAFLLWLW